MAKTMYEGANVATTDTFSQWLNRTNQIVYDMSTSVVTTAPFAQPNTINGAWTVGNAHVEGFFSSSTLVASTALRGGTVSVPGNLNVTSNTIFSRAETVHIQPNTANFIVNANTSLFSGNFEMNNTAKTFSIIANSTSIAHGPLNVSSNSTFTGANVMISGSNTTITSNTTILAANTVLNSNLLVTGANTNIHSDTIRLGDADTDTVYVTAKVGTNLIPVNTSIQLGNTSGYFGDTFVSNFTANGTAIVTGAATIGNNLTVNGNVGQFNNTVNANNVVIRTIGENQVPYYTTKVVGSGNFTYDGTTLNVIGNTDQLFLTPSLSVAGHGNVDGNFKIGANLVGNGNANINGVTNTQNLTVRSITGNRIPYANTTGGFVGSANMVYNGTTMTLNAASNATVVLIASGSANVHGSLNVISNATFGGTGAFTGALSTNDSLTVSALANTNALRIRSLTDLNSILFTTNAVGDVTSSPSLKFTDGALYVSSTTANGMSIDTTGGIKTAGVRNELTGSLDVGGNIEIVGNLIVRGATQLSSNVELSTNSSTISYLTVGPEIILSSSTKLVGSLSPKEHRIYDLGTAILNYRTVYANNFVGNVAWGSVTGKPNPVITITGDADGSGTMNALGNVSIAVTAVSANATANGVVSTGNQTFTGAKTFASTITGSITGNAGSATKLTTARTINGTSFDGTVNVTVASKIVRPAANAALIVPLPFVNDTYVNTANNAIKDLAIVDKLTYNMGTGTLVSVDFNSSSDERLKTNIETLPNALVTVSAMRGVKYTRVDTGAEHVGVIAQEVEQIVPELVGTDNDGYKYVSYGNMGGIFIEAIKELMTESANQRAEIVSLREEIERLKDTK